MGPEFFKEMEKFKIIEDAIALEKAKKKELRLEQEAQERLKQRELAKALDDPNDVTTVSKLVQRDKEFMDK